jgi:mono/diheme cytochrome c family protein
MTTLLKTPLTRFIVVAGVLLVGIAAGAATGQKPAPRVTMAPCVPIVSIEGKDNFDAFCVVCHGKDAKGNGPAAAAMKVPVPDLTSMARRHGGKFDAVAVEYILRGTGKTATPAHGVETMPIWGDAFSGDPAKVTIRIKNLVKYLENIQQLTTSH